MVKPPPAKNAIDEAMDDYISKLNRQIITPNLLKFVTALLSCLTGVIIFFGTEMYKDAKETKEIAVRIEERQVASDRIDIRQDASIEELSHQLNQLVMGWRVR